MFLKNVRDFVHHHVVRVSVQKCYCEQLYKCWMANEILIKEEVEAGAEQMVLKC